MYEIDFHPVGEGDCSGDAITFRYVENGFWTVTVIDGGYLATGESLVRHIRQTYNTNRIDYLISTHPDNDHMSGLRVLLEEMYVAELWMHVPPLHAQNILPLFRSRRNAANLERELWEKYPYVKELFDLAVEKGTRIYEPYAGQQIGRLTVLSPTLNMYEGLLPQFRDTPAPDQGALMQLGHWLEGIRVPPRARDERKIVAEDWFGETLRDGGMTSAENESSLVMLAEFEPARSVLFTSDAGLRALSQADYTARRLGKSIRSPSIFQVPHHGSRNNISPPALDYIVGNPLLPGFSSSVVSVISAGVDDPHHPRQVVVNALQRRGSTPYTTKSGILYFWSPDLAGRGWGAARSLDFAPMVERYD